MLVLSLLLTTVFGLLGGMTGSGPLISVALLFLVLALIAIVAPGAIAWLLRIPRDEAK